MTIHLNRRNMLTGAGALALILNGSASFAAPALPPAPKPEAWIKSPAIDFVGLSPDGNHAAYISDEGGVKNLISFDFVTKKPGKINIGNVEVEDLQWLDDSHVLVVTSVPAKRASASFGAGRLPIAIVYNVQAGSLLRLFDKVPKFAGLIGGDLNFIRKDGKVRVTASSTRDDNDGFNYLYAFDLDGKGADMIDRGPEETLGWVVTGDGTPVGRYAYYGVRREWVLEYNSGNGWKEIYREKVTRYIPDAYGLGRDGKSLLIKTYGDGDAGTYREISADGTLSAPLVEEASGHAPIIDQRTHKLIGFTHITAGIKEYDFFDPAMQAINTKAKTAMDGYRMEIVDYGDNPNKVILRSEGDDDAGSYYYIDFGTGLSIEMGGTYPDVPVEWIATKSVISYKAADGTTIEAILTLPPHADAKNLPLIVMPHSALLSRSDLSFDWMAATLAAAGYAILQPNYRGSTGYGQSFVTAMYGNWKKVVTDLSDGVRFLASQGTIDAKKVAIVGSGQIGGYLALAGVGMDSGVYRCAVDIAGLSDVDLLMATAAQGGDTTSPSYVRYRRYFGDDSGAVSPVRYASAVTVPVLVLGGVDMPGTPMQQSQRAADALHGELVKLSATGDWRTEENWRMEVMKPVLAFLAKNNPV